MVLLKPDAVARGLVGRVLGRFEDAASSHSDEPEARRLRTDPPQV